MSEHHSTTLPMAASLLGLPTELRLEILEHVFALPTVIRLYVACAMWLLDDRRVFSIESRDVTEVAKLPGILHVCSQLRSEAQDLFYKNTAFFIASYLCSARAMREEQTTSGQLSAYDAIPKHMLKQIRHCVQYGEICNAGNTGGYPHDLRQFRAMVNLQTIHVCFPTNSHFRIEYRIANDGLRPLVGLVESVPATAEIIVNANRETGLTGPGLIFKLSRRDDCSGGAHETFSRRHSKELREPYRSVREYLKRDSVMSRQGRYSGVIPED